MEMKPVREVGATRIRRTKRAEPLRSRSRAVRGQRAFKVKVGRSDVVTTEFQSCDRGGGSGGVIGADAYGRCDGNRSQVNRANGLTSRVSEIAGKLTETFIHVEESPRHRKASIVETHLSLVAPAESSLLR